MAPAVRWLLLLLALVANFDPAQGVICERPPDVNITNLDYDPTNTTEGSVATYTCQVGYRKAGGDSHKTCQSSGLWIGQDLICEYLDCGAPPVVARADLVTPPGYTSFHQVARYRCETGFQQVGGDEVRYCDQHGQWAGRDIKCRAVQCGAPPSVAGLQETYVVAKYGWTAEYACPSGSHHPDAPFVKVCNASGQWQGEVTATCSAIRCGTPPAGVHTTSITLLNDGGDYVTSYQCLGGSTATSGDFNLTCPRTGGTSWQGNPLQCSAPPSCGPPPVYANTNVTSDGRVPGSRAVYTCVEKYLDWNAPAVLTCAKDGTWVGQAPNCTTVECGAPPDVAHATYNTSGSTPGSTAVYVCEVGYTPSHNSTPFTASCDSYGDWSHVSHKCSVVDCGIPLNTSKSYAHYVSTTYNSIATYYCTPQWYNFGGEMRTTCQSNSSWTTIPASSCFYVADALPPVPNAVIIRFFKNGLFWYRFECLPNFAHSSGSQITNCGSSWDCATTMKCIEIRCRSPPDLMHMTVSYSQDTYLSTASYSCDSDFRQLGNQSLVCNRKGIWEGLPPLCETNSPLLESSTTVDETSSTTSFASTSTDFSTWQSSFLTSLISSESTSEVASSFPSIVETTAFVLSTEQRSAASSQLEVTTYSAAVTSSSLIDNSVTTTSDFLMGISSSAFSQVVSSVLASSSNVVPESSMVSHLGSSPADLVTSVIMTPMLPSAETSSQTIDVFQTSQENMPGTTSPVLSFLEAASSTAVVESKTTLVPSSSSDPMMYASSCEKTCALVCGTPSSASLEVSIAIPIVKKKKSRIATEAKYAVPIGAVSWSVILSVLLSVIVLDLQRLVMAVYQIWKRCFGENKVDEGEQNDVEPTESEDDCTLTDVIDD